MRKCYNLLGEIYNILKLSFVTENHPRFSSSNWEIIEKIHFLRKVMKK